MADRLNSTASKQADDIGGKGIFLTAEWKHLAMLNYAVDPAMLRCFAPSGTELDSFDGKTYVSLVGFQFNRTRVFGWAIPFHQEFEEVNLRFYVRRGLKRGVVFIREFVPKIAVAAIARLAYNEKYAALPMSHRIELSAGGHELRAEYLWGSGADQCSIKIETESPGCLPPEGGLGQFITEHYWGYAAQPDRSCVEYEVRHERWSIRPAKLANFTGNAAKFYGEEFGQVLKAAPDSAFLIDGSPVIVCKRKRII